MGDPQIKRFVQERLGCSCPEEVFDRIECETDVSCTWWKRIDVGHRLLIYILDATDVSDLTSTVLSALQQGVTERNTGGFNRFRLVVASSIPIETKATAEDAFLRSNLRDDRTHLHIVALEDIEGF